MATSEVKLSQYAERAYQLFLFCLIVLIYNPWGVIAYGESPPKKWMRYLYLGLILGFLLSTALYVILSITESGENWLDNIRRKPITYWHKNDTEAQVEAEQKRDEATMQPSALISFVAYPLMFYAFRDLADSLVKKTGLHLYGVGQFYNPFQPTEEQPGISHHLMSFLLTSLSSMVFIFNYGSVVELFLPEKWKTIGSAVIAGVTSLVGLVYYAVKLHKGDFAVTPIGTVTPSFNLTEYLKQFGIMFAATLLIGYPVNPLLEWLRQRWLADGYWVSIVSSISTLLLARHLQDV